MLQWACFRLLVVAVLTFVSLVTGAPTPIETTPTLTATTAAYSPSFVCLRRRAALSAQILASTNGTAVTGLELTDTEDAATLTADGFDTAWTFKNGALGAWNFCTWKYLNIGESTQSYKPLIWSFQKKTTSWVGAYDSDLSVSLNSGVVTQFLACKRLDGKGGWLLFLQTGTQLPLMICAQTTLHITKAF